jgi:hypothetical protein
MAPRPARFALLAFAAVSLARADVPWLPPGLPPAPATGPALCPGDFLKPAQGAAVLDATLAQFPDRARWDTYAAHLRTRIQEAAGLAPWPKRTPLNAIIRDRRTHDGYTVENVAFESAPGVFVTGNLYRPTGAIGKHPVILSTHGHARPVTKPEDYDTHARFSPTMQTRCANLARMGAIVFSIDMFANGEGIQLYGLAAHRDTLAITIHVWNGMRALDFLLGPLFEAGKVYAPPTMHRTLSDGRTIDILEQFLVEEYDRFPVGAHDDGMDCLARITDPDMNATFPLLDAEPERYSKRRTNGSAWAA